jgi:hypothetical protein
VRHPQLLARRRAGWGCCCLAARRADVYARARLLLFAKPLAAVLCGQRRSRSLTPSCARGCAQAESSSVSVVGLGRMRPSQESAAIGGRGSSQADDSDRPSTRGQSFSALRGSISAEEEARRSRAASTASAQGAKKAAERAKKAAPGAFLGGFLQGALAPVIGGSRNPHGHQLLPARTSEMSGYLYKQGSKIGAWQKRYFLLHGSLMSYYQSEEEAQEPDEAQVRWTGMVTEATAWPSDYGKKPAQVRRASSAERAAQSEQRRASSAQSEQRAERAAQSEQRRASSAERAAQSEQRAERAAQSEQRRASSAEEQRRASSGELRSRGRCRLHRRRCAVRRGTAADAMWR